jgi:hypothetical protein
MIESRGRSVLDTPQFAGYDDRGWCGSVICYCTALQAAA